MHVHTDDSPDADIPARELVIRGLNENLAGIGFVAHVDLNPEDFCYKGFQGEVYDRSIELAQKESNGRLLVLKGLEIGEPHKYEPLVREIADYSRFDFITGALHSVEGAGMILGEEAYRDADPLEIVEQYYTETLLMVETSDIDILAHMGLFRRGLAIAGLEHDFNEIELWPDTIHRILRTIIDRNIALELNTSGLRRKENTTYPKPQILELFCRIGGSIITLGSDSHREPYIFYGLEDGRQLLIETGFEEVFFFKNRIPQKHSLH